MPRRKKGSSSNGGVNSGKSGSSMSINKGKPQQRNAANARERARMRVLSRAFCRLKTTLPWVPADTKLSKLDTLRLAASYIAHLKGILSDDPYSSSEEPTTHPAMSLTWPFGFNRPSALLEGNGSSVGGGSEAEEVEESIGGSSSGWEPESPTKDCVHLDSLHSGRTNTETDLLANKHIQMHHDQGPHSNNFKSHIDPGIISNSEIPNNNILPYNFHQATHHPYSTINYGFQNDIILSKS